MANRKPVVLNGNGLQVLQSGDVIPVASLEAPAMTYTRTDCLFNPRVPPMTTGSTLTSGRGYFTYLGQIIAPFVANYVRFAVQTAGAGTQTAEVAVYSSASAPVPGVSASLTRLAVSTTLESLTTVGAKKNVSAMGYTIAAGTHVWVGLRTVMGTTQVNVGRAQDPVLGEVQSGASAALDTVSPQTSIGIQGLNTVCPYLTLWT